MDKKKRSAQKQLEDRTLDRVLLWFGAAVLIELLVLLANRFYINYRVGEINFVAGLDKFIWILGYVALAAAVVGAVWAWRSWQGGEHRSFPAACAFFFLVLGLSCFVIRKFKESGVQLLQVAVPVVAVLALIYYLYQREFFCITALSGMGLLALWIYRRSNGGHLVLLYTYLAVLAVLLLGGVLLARALQKGDGILRRGGQELRLLPRGANYATIYATCGFIAACVIAAFLLGSAAAYYIFLVLVAWIFVMAVYYTVKLM